MRHQVRVAACALLAALASVNLGAGQAPKPPQPPKTVRLSVFDCGVIKVNRAGTERCEECDDSNANSRLYGNGSCANCETADGLGR
jgi:hypothetical protein